MTTTPSEANTSDQEHLEEQVLSTDSETGNTTSITVSTTNSPTPAMNQAPRGAADLPIEGTKGAPKKFKGHSATVEDFLRRYEKLCTKYNVTDGRERIENITQYCSREVREFLEGLTSYRGNNWDAFKQDFKEFFNADKDERRFRTKDLDRYVIVSRKESNITSLEAWQKYNRGFICIAGWLILHRKILVEQYNTSFWQ